MIGYKALNKNMSSTYGDMIYELNKEYEITGKFKMCENGYHFCDNPIDTYRFYHVVENPRIFKIDTLDGKIIEDEWDEKFCSSKIKLIEELSIEDVKKYIKDHLQYLVNKRSELTRAAIVYLGYGFKELEDDPSTIVKRELIRQHYNLDKYMDDNNPYVRAYVAAEGYGLDKLAKDPNKEVSKIANFILNKLYHDKGE